MPVPGLKLSLGFSPCPNDTFMFDALVHHKVDTEDLEFDIVMEDVESLNQRAIRNELDISKVSFAAYAHSTDQYVLLNSGSALGHGIGPLLVCNPANNFNVNMIWDYSVAIPGKHTTANFLFSIFFPQVKNKIELVFSEIEKSVLSGKTDAGVIIHEGRFTYEKKGLKKVCDLGELWFKMTEQPIPLGGIIAKRNLAVDTRQKIDRVLKRSVEYAFEHPESSREYVRKHAQEMDEDVIRKHIELYVNKYSVNLGSSGRQAVEILFHKAKDAGVIESVPENIFMNAVAELSND
jgi:1,4-dihydroxy-6-naphthoate synthase